MKRVFYFLAPILVAILVFAIIVLFVTRGNGKGALQVTSTPTAKVYLNDKLIGQTPLCDCDLNDMIDVGDYTIKLIPTKGEFEPFEQKISISSKVLTVVDRSFAQAALSEGSIINLSELSDKNQAEISVISFPDSAQVFLDNNSVGQTPILLKNVTESDHELKLTKEGYRDKIVRIRAVLGYELEALIFLGINPQEATASATLNSSPSAVLLVAKVLILPTPTGFLRVRQSASVDSAEVGQVKPGETYDLLDEQSGWYKIKLTNDKEGWVSSQYVQKQ